MKINSIGFTLLELMVTVAIVAILAAIAYPSYTSFVLRSHRSEAIQGLLSAQLKQEKWRVTNGTYTTVMTNLGNPTSNYYSFTATVGSGAVPSYVLTATATGSQTSDSGCGSLSITNQASKAPASCWQ